jgi:carboxymethylenebutenolidase
VGAYQRRYVLRRKSATGDLHGQPPRLFQSQQRAPCQLGVALSGFSAINFARSFNSSHVVRTRFRPNFMVIKDNEFIDIPTPAGPMRTHVLYPVAEGRYPGIVLFSEIFQVTGPIRRSAALLAGHGFVVVIPEIFHELEEPGTVLPYDQAGADRGNADKINKELSSYDADAKAALSYLKSHSKCTGKIGSMGFCIGGHLAFRSATNPEVLAATCCYPTDIHKRSLGKGLNDDTLDRIPEIRGELLVVFGRQDPHIPREGRATIYNALADAGTNFSWHEFMAPMHSCGTKALDTMRPPHGLSTPWRWIYSGVSLAKATSRKFKAPLRRAIRRIACGLSLEPARYDPLGIAHVFRTPPLRYAVRLTKHPMWPGCFW